MRLESRKKDLESLKEEISTKHLNLKKSLQKRKKRPFGMNLRKHGLISG